MKQIFHARKKRQLRFLVKKLKRLIKNANENTQTQINYLVKQIRIRTKELSKLVATSYLKKVVGSVALVAGLSFSTQVSAQTFEAPVDNPFGLNTTTYYNLPAFADMDNDGDMDIIMSHIGVSIDYYENVGDVNAPSFAAPVEGAFGIGIIDTDVMTLGDLDGDGDFDLIATTYGGGVSFRENTGDASSPQFAAPVADPFGISFISNYVNFPSLVDIDADGDLDLFIGASNKNLEDKVQLDLSPNPVQNELTIKTDGDFDRIEIFNTTGQLIKAYSGRETLVQLGTWNSGVYLIRFIDQEGNFLTRKIRKE